MEEEDYSLLATRYSLDLREQIVLEARSWVGTPYHHQASLKGVGCDCLGLIRGVWRAAIGPEPEAMPPYSGDWGDTDGAETLLALGRRHFVEVRPAEMAPGDVVVFRLRGGRVAKHCGILTGSQKPETGNQRHLLASGVLASGFRFIHAQERVPVAEVALSDWWRRRIAGAFRFPERVAK